MTWPFVGGPAWGLNQAFNDTNIRGTQITSSATTNTKGSYTQLVASMPYEACGLLISWVTTATADVAIDIAVGSAGNENIIIDNLLNNSRGITTSVCSAYFPVSVASGARISARCAATTGSTTAFVGVTAFKGGANVLAASGKIVQLGTLSTSRGVQVAASASANTFGSWKQIAATAGFEIAGLLMGIGCNGSAAKSSTSMRWAVGVGAAAAEQTLYEFGDSIQGSVTVTPSMGYGLGFIPVRIGASQRVAVRLMNSAAVATAANRTHDVLLYGIVA